MTTEKPSHPQLKIKTGDIADVNLILGSKSATGKQNYDVDIETGQIGICNKIIGVTDEIFA